MRRHGPSASRISAEVSDLIAESMWCLRVLREARSGAIVVAGPRGEVLRVDLVATDKSFVATSCTPFIVRPEILAKVGPRWVQEDLKALGDASVTPTRDRPSAAAPGQRAGTNLPRKAKATGDARKIK